MIHSSAHDYKERLVPVYWEQCHFPSLPHLKAEPSAFGMDAGLVPDLADLVP